MNKATLECLKLLIPKLPAELDSSLLSEIAHLLTESDLRLAALALTVVSLLVQSRGGDISALVKEKVWDKVLELAASPLLQGQVLTGMLDLLQHLVEVCHGFRPSLLTVSHHPTIPSHHLAKRNRALFFFWGGGGECGVGMGWGFFRFLFLLSLFLPHPSCAKNEPTGERSAFKFHDHGK